MTDLSVILSYEQTISVLEALEANYDSLLRTADAAVDDGDTLLHDGSMAEARGLLQLYAAIAAAVAIAVPAGPLNSRISQYLLRENGRLNAEPPSYSDLEEYAEYVEDHIKTHGTVPLTLTEWRFGSEFSRQEVPS